MKRTLFLLALGLAPFALAVEPLTLKLWPNGAPEPAGYKSQPEERIEPKNESDVLRIGHVSDPTLTVYRAEKPNGTAVIVCPGGGYNILAYEHEGTQVCEWLNSHGVTGILLKYRVPARDKQNPSKEPIQDVQRAMGLARHHADEWGIKKDRIGILGFSAGGNLCILAGLHADQRTYTTDPAVDTDDVRPNFLIPIYPAYLTVQKDDSKLRPEIAVTPNSPPIFLIHAHDDRITPAGSALLYLEYKKLGLPAELHIYNKGGHGYGMHQRGLPVHSWPQRAAEWLKDSGWLQPTK